MGRRLSNVAHFVPAQIRVREPPGSPRMLRPLNSSSLAGSPRPNLSGRKLAATWRVRSREDSSPAMQGSSVKLTSLARSNATVNLEAVPDFLPKADDDVRLLTADRTHRRRLKSRNGFERRCTPFLTRRPQLDPSSGILNILVRPEPMTLTILGICAIIRKIKGLEHGNAKPGSGNIMGTITRFRGACRAFRSDQSLVNTGVSKTVFYGMEEVIGSIPIRSTN